MLLIGLFMTVGGAYAMIQTIIDQYAANLVSSAFSCADKCVPYQARVPDGSS